jgi:hypothetical protein
MSYDLTLVNGLKVGSPVVGVDAAFSSTLGAAGISSTTFFVNPKMKITAEGGFAVSLTNKTGAPSVKGTIVSISTGTDNAFALSAVNASGVVGVVYEAGKADAAECFVVVKGIAETLFTNNVTHGMYARAPITADTDEVAGKAVGAAIPAATFNTDAYLARFGFVLESKNAGSLAKVLLD